MAPRTLPGIGLQGYETAGAPGWNAFADPNWRLISVWLQARVISIVSSLPGAPSNGDVHIMTTGVNANSLAVYDNGAWVYLAPKTGCRVYDEGTDKHWTYITSAWVPDYEDGFDANGTYRKYADGKLECRSPTLTQDVTTAAGSIYRSVAATWTMPYAMIDTTFDIYPTTISNAATHWGSARPSGTTGVEYVIYSFGSYATRNLRLSAMGRWV